MKTALCRAISAHRSLGEVWVGGHSSWLSLCLPHISGNVRTSVTSGERFVLKRSKSLFYGAVRFDRVKGYVSHPGGMVDDIEPHALPLRRVSCSRRHRSGGERATGRFRRS